jgi:Tfp pilus assembly PilM family ATPase
VAIALSTPMNAVRARWSSGGRSGWIGVDIGSRLIKLAQVERTSAGWRLAGRWTIGDQDSGENSEPLGQGEIGSFTPQIKTARRLFRGRAAAAALPMSWVNFRCLDLPTAPWCDVLAMVEQELAAECGSSEQSSAFDAWQAESGNEGSKIIAVSIEPGVGQRVAGDLLAAGLHCQVLDVVPCALARAVGMRDPAADDEPIAALDLGDTTASLTIVHRRRPVFCRVLRECGLNTLMQGWHDRLGMARSECRQLLTRFGLPRARGAGCFTSTDEMFARPFEQLVDEICKTFQFIEHQTPHFSPRRTWVFGGGAMVRNMDGFLEERTGLVTGRWTLAASSGADNSDPLYGVAAGLSLLAWESDACT